MNPKSLMISNILKILLWAMLVCGAVSLIGTIVAAIDADFYLDRVYTVDGFVGMTSAWLYYIVIFVYLVWVYRVHMDLNALFPRYPRSSGAAIACMIVPLYNLYGIPSTYSLIAGSFSNDSVSARTQGRRLRLLVVPLFVGVLASRALNSAVRRNIDEGAGTMLWLIAGTVDLLTYGVYLAIALLVSQGLSNAYSDLSRPGASNEAAEDEAEDERERPAASSGPSPGADVSAPAPPMPPMPPTET